MAGFATGDNIYGIALALAGTITFKIPTWPVDVRVDPLLRASQLQ